MRGPAVLCLMVATIASGLSAQTNGLNPTVKVLPKPRSAIPTDCDTGLAPALPRPTQIAEVSEPAPGPAVAPSADLRTRLRRVQSAAENGDHDAFKSALAEARSAAAAHPGGGEKQAANDALQVYGDLERLWDFSFSSPTGSFFDESSENGAIVNAMRKYPEFPRSVADATMTIRGVTIYPTRETRQILVAEAGKRLSRLGVRTPSRVVQETPRVTEAPRRPAAQPKVQPQPQPQPRTTKPRAVQVKPAQPKPVQKSATKAPAVQHRSTAVVKPPVKIAQAAPKPVVRHEEPPRSQPVIRQPQPQPQPQPVTPRPVTPQPVTPRPVTPQPVMPQPVTPQPVTPQPVTPPVVSAPMTTTTALPPNTTTYASATTTTSAAQTETTTTTAAAATDTTSTDTTSTATPPTNGKPAGMNMTFAIILIVVGIGVLIVLFRASD